MRTDRRTLLLISALAVIFTFASAATAQKVGGYTEISKSDSGARSAAVFAVGAQAEKTGGTVELVAVQQAERQVVAGTNYRLCLKVTTSGGKDEADATITVKVVVYRDLKGNYKLSSWTEENCGDDDDDN